MADERWVSTHRLCNGFASYNGPCGDPYCSDCYPGGEVCTQCSELKGCCECDNCEKCGEAWMEDYGKQYDECPHCVKYCMHCGELEQFHDPDICTEDFESGEIQTDQEHEDELVKIRARFRKKRGPTSIIKIGYYLTENASSNTEVGLRQRLRLRRQ